jgi:formamidopyrimidine-DNA glycosylase
MPELPEVETVVRDLRAHGLEGAVIREAAVRWPRTVAGMPPAAFAESLKGHAVAAVSRRAKYIVLVLDSGDRLLVHLRMTGKLRFAAADEAPGKHDHLVITFADGRRLVFNDTRKFGRFRLATAGAADPLAGLGPEPLEDAFTPDALRQRLEGKTRQLKPLLLDQTAVAGLGNIYVDEALWQARLHPERRADTLTRAETRRLHAAIRAVLRRAIANNGTTLGDGEANFYSVAGRRGRNADALRVFRRDGLPCPRCGTAITRSVVGQRGTHFCPRCQSPPISSIPSD